MRQNSHALELKLGFFFSVVRGKLLFIWAHQRHRDLTPALQRKSVKEVLLASCLGGVRARQHVLTERVWGLDVSLMVLGMWTGSL